MREDEFQEYTDDALHCVLDSSVALELFLGAILPLLPDIRPKANFEFKHAIPDHLGSRPLFRARLDSQVVDDASEVVNELLELVVCPVFFQIFQRLTGFESG